LDYPGHQIVSCSVTSLPERELGSFAIAGIPFMLGLGPVKADGWPKRVQHQYRGWVGEKSPRDRTGPIHNCRLSSVYSQLDYSGQIKESCSVTLKLDPFPIADIPFMLSLGPVRSDGWPKRVPHQYRGWVPGESRTQIGGGKITQRQNRTHSQLYINLLSSVYSHLDYSGHQIVSCSVTVLPVRETWPICNCRHPSGARCKSSWICRSG
jgi:hypothetical protein